MFLNGYHLLVGNMGIRVCGEIVVGSWGGGGGGGKGTCIWCMWMTCLVLRG